MTAKEKRLKILERCTPVIDRLEKSWSAAKEIVDDNPDDYAPARNLESVEQDLYEAKFDCRQELINTIDIPEGMRLKDIQDTKWNSIYFLVRKVFKTDEDGYETDYEDYKLSIRDHEPSIFREKEFGAVDAWYEVSKEPSLDEIEKAVSAVERFLVKHA